MANYSVFEIGSYADLGEVEVNNRKGRVMVNAANIGATGCIISFNSTPAGGFSPMVHSHKTHEEVYIVISGNGFFYVDGDEFPIKEGTVIRVAPAGKHAIKAGDETLVHMCIQVPENAPLATSGDGIRHDDKPSWFE